MKRTIYHGSEKIIKQSAFGQGKPYNDYGLGFYCTENEDLAKEWAVRRERDGFANAYEIEEAGLKILSLQEEKYSILHWLAVLLENRHFEISQALARTGREYLLQTFLPPYQKYDVVIGYRADDSYFSFAQDFLNGTIPLRQLKEAMYLGKLGEQYVLRSKKAFGAISFLDYAPAPAEEWFLKRQMRDRQARTAYFDMDKNVWRAEDIFITDILREEIKSDDPRIR